MEYLDTLVLSGLACFTLGLGINNLLESYSSRNSARENYYLRFGNYAFSEELADKAARIANQIGHYSQWGTVELGIAGILGAAALLSATVC